MHNNSQQHKFMPIMTKLLDSQLSYARFILFLFVFTFTTAMSVLPSLIIPWDCIIAPSLLLLIIQGALAKTGTKDHLFSAAFCITPQESK